MSNDVQEANVDLADDFLESMGLESKPLTPEDALMTRFTEGSGFTKIHEYRYLVRHELFAYYHIQECGYDLTKWSVDKDTKIEYKKKADKYDWLRIRTKYYLQMKFLPWFTQDMSGLGSVDYNKIIDMLMSHPYITEVIEARPEDLPRN